MFRVDGTYVVDATMCGNAARFINHSCEVHRNSYSTLITNSRRPRGSYSGWDGLFVNWCRFCPWFLRSVLTNRHWMRITPTLVFVQKFRWRFHSRWQHGTSRWWISWFGLIRSFYCCFFSQTVIHVLSILMVKRKSSSSQQEGILVSEVLTILYLCICKCVNVCVTWIQPVYFFFHFVSFQAKAELFLVIKRGKACGLWALDVSLCSLSNRVNVICSVSRYASPNQMHAHAQPVKRRRPNCTSP